MRILPSIKNPRQFLPAAIPPECITAQIDSREQRPLNLHPLRVETATLATGDYTVRGLENHVAIERKSLDDLIACCGRERARFDREIMRLQAYPVRAVVVESTWPALEMGGWRGQVTPAQATGSVLGWIASGVPFLFVGSHEAAGRVVAKILAIAARRRWREARSLVANITVAESPELEGAA